MVGIKINGNLLKRIREERNLTQEELESLCGFSKNYIYWLEKGKGNPSEENLDKLLSALNIPIDELCNNNYTENTKWEGPDDSEIFSKPFGKDLESCIKRVGILNTYFVRDVLGINSIALKEMLEGKWCGPLSTFARVYKVIYTEDHPDVDFKILDSYIRVRSGNRFMRSIVKYCFINNISANQFRVEYGTGGHDILFWNNKNEVPSYRLYIKICDTLGDEFIKYLYTSKYIEEVKESHIYYRFNDVFKEFRISHEYNLTDLAEVYGVSINVVSRWECGYMLPPKDKLETVMNAIGKSYNPDVVKFGVLLNLCRECLDYDRAKLGERIGVSEYIICSFERGVYPPTRNHFEILADTLESDLTYA